MADSVSKLYALRVPAGTLYPERMAKLTDNTLDMGVPMRERYERFCVKFVESRNAMHAYRTSFVTNKSHLVDWVDEQSRKLLADPEIAERIQSIRDTAAAQLLISIRDLMQDDADIVAADPNEIISYVRENCRFCRGEGNAYQWKDINEFMAELERVTKFNSIVPEKDREPLPNDAGGYGFDPTRDPVSHCPACFGEGTGRTLIHDTRKLSPQARKLYAGVKETSNGIEVKMHDKDKARERLGRTLGAFKDGVPVIPVQPVNQPVKPATVEEAGKTYLQLIQGGKR